MYLSSPSRLCFRFQSTLPMRGATFIIDAILVWAVISIHTPHAGSDPLSFQTLCRRSISIHTPHAGSDSFKSCKNSSSAIFQSTLPMRGATFAQFSTSFTPIFQSTLPMRGATGPVSPVSPLGPYFNPHSPCGERPSSVMVKYISSIYFNPHSPCGERPTKSSAALTLYLFQSTLPMRGATFRLFATSRRAIISIHTPHAGSDSTRHRSPVKRFRISIHTPHAGSDAAPETSAPLDFYFNPHSPCGERHTIKLCRLRFW